MLTDEYRYRILKILESNPSASQRDIARELGVSLGRVNFCLQALIEKGLIKANNFRNSTTKQTYLYLLTPKGIDEKAKVTLRFLKSKLAEYESIKAELEELQKDATKYTPKTQIESPKRIHGETKSHVKGSGLER